MRKALVTGCAGFIGSHLVERLLAMGVEVRGVDCFTPYYDRALKEGNMAAFREASGFHFTEADLVDVASPDLLDGVDTVFHLAAQAGVRASWGEFDTYLHHNLLATQRLLAAAAQGRLERFVMASSSSVYGNAPAYPTREDGPCAPVSPYGVTKLACEHLAWTYVRAEQVPVVALRFFTVYGPRQRPDMAFNIFIRHALEGKPLPIFGDGSQTRDFTYVDDIVEGTLRAATAPGAVGQAINLGGGARRTLSDVLDVLDRVVGRPLERAAGGVQKGDARDTGASLSKARELLGFAPQVDLESGLRRELEWLTASSSAARRG
ncbi:MAG: NAD-dependent epimerase/dehydratase family protein [Candidatus Xenobia bacterium]